MIRLVNRVERALHAQVQARNAVLKVKDGASASITIKIGEGDFSWTEARNMEYTTDRGRLDEVREGDEVPMELTFSFNWTKVISTGTGTAATGTAGTGGSDLIQNAIKGKSGYVSTDADSCRPYACDIELTITPPCTGGETVYTFPDFRWEKFDSSLKNGTVNCSGKCNALEPILS